MTNEGSSFKVGGAYPIDRRYALATDIPQIKVYNASGTLLEPSVVQAGATAFTANGATQFFAVTFPVAFTAVYSVVFSLKSPIALVWSTINGYTTTTFTVQVLDNAAAFLPAATIFEVDWIAVGK